MCAGPALRAGVGANCEVWLFQISNEQQRHVRNAGPARRVCTQKGVCGAPQGYFLRGVATLANGMTIGCVPHLASIPFVYKRIFRYLLKQARNVWIIL